MFVIYNKESTCVKIATTEHPTIALDLKTGWDVDYAVAEFPDVDIDAMAARFLQVVDGNLVDRGSFAELEQDPILIEECNKASPDIFN